METWDEARWGTGTEQKSRGLNIIQQKTIIQWIKLKNTGSQTHDSDNGIDATWHLVYICERLWKLSIVFMRCWLFLCFCLFLPVFAYPQHWTKHTSLSVIMLQSKRAPLLWKKPKASLVLYLRYHCLFVLVLQLSCQLLSHKNYITLWF